jgi:hypothetical protein
MYSMSALVNVSSIYTLICIMLFALFGISCVLGMAEYKVFIYGRSMSILYPNLWISLLSTGRTNVPRELLYDHISP